MNNGRGTPDRAVWQQRAANAAQQLGPASQRARAMAGDRVIGAREWSAPQLHRAAEIMEHDVAPRLSAMMHSAASRIEPPRRGNRLRNVLLAACGVVGVLGIVGALFAFYRLRSDYEIEEIVEVTESGPISEQMNTSRSGDSDKNS